MKASPLLYFLSIYFFVPSVYARDDFSFIEPRGLSTPTSESQIIYKESKEPNRKVFLDAWIARGRLVLGQNSCETFVKGLNDAVFNILDQIKLDFFAVLRCGTYTAAYDTKLYVANNDQYDEALRFLENFPKDIYGHKIKFEYILGAIYEFELTPFLRNQNGGLTRTGRNLYFQKKIDNFRDYDQFLSDLSRRLEEAPLKELMRFLEKEAGPEEVANLKPALSKSNFLSGSGTTYFILPNNRVELEESRHVPSRDCRGTETGMCTPKGA